MDCRVGHWGWIYEQTFHREFFEIVVGYQYIQLFCAIEGAGFQNKEFIFGSLAGIVIKFDCEWVLKGERKWIGSILFWL